MRYPTSPFLNSNFRACVRWPCLRQQKTPRWPTFSCVCAGSLYDKQKSSLACARNASTPWHAIHWRAFDFKELVISILAKPLPGVPAVPAVHQLPFHHIEHAVSDLCQPPDAATVCTFGLCRHTSRV